MEESGSVAGLGGVERGLLSATDQRVGLDGRRIVEGLYAIDRSGSGFSDSQKRLKDSSDLAPETRAGVGSHLRLLPGLFAVENAGANV